jgi:hypothetical protein
VQLGKNDWWERRWFHALLVAISTVPLLWPEIPPLGDLPGHMGRFRVQLDLAHSPSLQRYFEYHWMLVGNLGTDLLVQLLGPVMGLEPAVKLIVVAIPAITAAGMIWTAKEAHGRVPPTIMFAIPFAYNFTFSYGFLNYSLGLGLALLAFALWLRLSDRGRDRTRLLLFVPISCALWVVHAYGWGILGLMAFSAQLVRHRQQGSSWLKAAIRSAIDVAPMGLPLIVMILGSGGIVTGETGGFFIMFAKLVAAMTSLRDKWLIWDTLSLCVILMLFAFAAFDRRVAWSPKLVAPAVVMGCAFLILPIRILGLSYGDWRLAPVVFILAILALRPARDGRAAHLLAWMGLIFLCLRIGGNTASYAIESRETDRMLAALDHVPRGAPVLFLSGAYCNGRTEMPRQAHLGSMVIVRREGFSNDQWDAAGAQLLRVRYARAGFFTTDKSSFLFDDGCTRLTEAKAGRPMRYGHRVDDALGTFPRDAFDYVWMIDPPGFDMKARPGLVPVWRIDRSVLYRVDHGQRQGQEQQDVRPLPR